MSWIALEGHFKNWIKRFTNEDNLSQLLILQWNAYYRIFHNHVFKCLTETVKRKLMGKEMTCCELFSVLSAILNTLLKPSNLIFMSELSRRHYYLHFTRNPTSENLNKFAPNHKISRVNTQAWMPYSKTHCCIESTLAINDISRISVACHIKWSYYTTVKGSLRDPG